MIDFLEVNSIQIVFIVCAMIGGVMHYLKKFLKQETNVKIYEWFGSANFPATLYTVIVFFFAIVGAIAADVVNSQTGFWAAMYSGFVTGFAIDAGFNSDKNPAVELAATKKSLNELFEDEKETKPASAAKPVIKSDPAKKVVYRPKSPETQR